ncbi:MAG TPA: DUF3305 domain-containing protein [Beijerinckiaceae bacterium]|nr:DUF3305 domain-containing protein [Beijerinckiaceae bacterium]
MVEMTIRVGVVAERRPVDHPWVDHVWEAVAVLPDAPAVAPGTILLDQGGVVRLYAGSADIVLASSDTAQYRDNLMRPPPRLWVVLRERQPEASVEVVAVTADPMEAEGHAEDSSNIVGALTMDADMAAAVALFVDTHHVEQVFVKRQRKRHRDGEAEA